MKVLFSFSLPFFLAHGGSQTLIEALMRELTELGVEVEPVRWWDENQTGDILHYIGRPTTLSVRLAHQKGFKIVMTDPLDQPASRSRPRQFAQRSFNRIFGRVVPKFTGQFSWEIFREVDAMVYSVPHEWEAAKYLFNADPGRGHVIPHGLEEAALRELARPQLEEDYLISVATINERKNTILLAEAARIAKVPVMFLGKPFSEEDSYFRRFQQLIDGQFVRYPGFVSAGEKYGFLRGARGFALLSQFESGCIAVFEAAGAGLPLLLSDRPWAKKSYPEARDVRFAKIGTAASLAPILSRFFDEAHRKSGPTFPLFSWNEIAKRYRAIYEDLLRRPAEKRL